MTTLVLQRTSRTRYGTFSELTGPDGHEAYILEPTGCDNAHDTSCIVPGTYNATKIGPTDKFNYDHYAVNDTPGRENIRMHRGNTSLDTDGCMLPGMDQTDQGVWHSTDALNLLLTKYPSGFTLVVKEIDDGSN